MKRSGRLVASRRVRELGSPQVTVQTAIVTVMIMMLATAAVGTAQSIGEVCHRAGTRTQTTDVAVSAIVTCPSRSVVHSSAREC